MKIDEKETNSVAKLKQFYKMFTIKKRFTI